MTENSPDVKKPTKERESVILAKCHEGHVNVVMMGIFLCPECRHGFVSKGWMPAETAREILATHGKELR